jgi:ABC-type antimicrobial peptide transport system permease subunit
VRSRLPLSSLVSAIASEVHALDPTLPLAIKTMDARVADAMWRTRVGAWLLGAFAGLALLLTAIGIFGVMAQSVMQRTAEIGVRMALGAQAGDVVRLMLRRATAVTVAGVGLGVAFALGLTRLLSAMLYGVRPYDPVAFGAAALLLAGVALLACYLPARRAARVDAVVALRSE